MSNVLERLKSQLGEVEPNAIFQTSREGFAAAMTEARDLLNLGRSRLTRTEQADADGAG